MHKTFTKSFPPDGTFTGTIVPYGKEMVLWKVRYEDGDEEEIDYAELQALLNPSEEPPAKKAK